MLSQARLLIVDDVFDNRAILGRRLRRQGFETAEAESGPEALALLAEQPFDLVLLDVMMPGMDGYEVLARIRETHSQLSLPVIMVTAKTESEDVVRAFELGANDFINKPVNFAIALSRVRAQLAQKRVEETMSATNNELERQVAERTRELTHVNANLQEQIEESTRAAAKIRHLVYHDTLTGLGNRASYHETLERTLARVRRQGECAAVLCLDLDHFKGVNDTLGHPAGDTLLQQVAARLIACSRDTDMIARLGGDEFAIVQAALRSAEDAGALAARIINVMGEPFDLDGQQVVIGASIGLATAPADGTEADQLLKNADLALYRAKSEGRNIYRFFQPEMDRRAQARRQLELEMRKALLLGEFELHFQPLFDLESRGVTGFEALIRWNHPARGTLMPAEFLPLAEQTGAIVQIGEWMIAKACAHATEWPDDTRVSVNISSAQFKSPRLVEIVRQALETTGLDPTRLELEITESVLFESSQATITLLYRLHDLGVRISMDEFGTGYSSLSYVRRFPFDRIKIDSSFVKDLVAHEECAAIVRAVSGLGKSLGIRTTADGVETEAQLESLKAQGCTEVQGQFLSPPRPSTDVPALIAAFGPNARTCPLAGGDLTSGAGMRVAV